MPFDTGYEPRTFGGDENPPVKPPSPAKAAVHTSTPTNDGDVAVQAPLATPAKAAKAWFNVVDNGDDTFSAWLHTDDPAVPFEEIGKIPGSARKVLEASGAYYNEGAKVWQKVPEASVRSLVSGDLPFPAYIEAKYKKNKAVIANGLIWDDWLRGGMSLEDATSRGDIELLKHQVKDAPLFVWQGNISDTVAKMWGDLKDAGPTGVGRRVAGEVAGQAAYMTDAPMATAAGMTLAASLIPTGGGSAPAVAAALATSLEVGSSALVFRRSWQIEGGNAADEMLRKGFDEKTVRKLAPFVGVMNGALETVGFHMLPAPYKRVIAAKVLQAPAVRRVLANAYISYMKELGTEVATEVAQEYVNVYAEGLAAEIDAKPNLAPKAGETVSRLGDIALQTLAGVAGMKAPGLGFELRSQHLETKKGKETTARIEARAVAQDTKTREIDPTEANKLLEQSAKGEQTPSGADVGPMGVYTPPEQETKIKALEDVSEAADAGKTSPDELTQAVDKIVAAEAEAQAASSGLEDLVATGKTQQPKVKVTFESEPQKVAAEVRQTLEEKTREAESKGAAAAAEAKRKAIATRTDDLILERNRLSAKGFGVARLDDKINDLIDIEESLAKEQTFYEARPAPVITDKKTNLLIRPATLEDVVHAGFQEGKREGSAEGKAEVLGIKARLKHAIATRAPQVKEVLTKLQLTNADTRVLLRDKNIGVMGDAEFKHWFDGYKNAKGEQVAGFRQKALEYAKAKAARNEVKRFLAERGVKNEHHIRALHELPPVAKMTKTQLHKYLDILAEYEEGAIPIPPKHAETLEGTKFAGAKTYQEFLTRASEELKVSVPALLNSARGEFDYLRGDTELSEFNAVYLLAVDRVHAETAVGDALYQEFERTNTRLGAAALASRSRLQGFIAPSMPEVMANMEANPQEVFAKRGVPGEEIPLAELTPEEQTYANFLTAFYSDSLGYLQQDEEFKTRWADMYAPHTARPFAEIVKGIKGFADAKAAAKEVFDNVFSTQKELLATAAPGALGMRKRFGFAEFRSGELTPSRNVIASANSYAKQFFRKQALDRAVPVVDTMMLALRAVSQDKTEEGQKAWESLHQFVKTYLNNKKGINPTLDFIAPRGGVIDVLARFVSGWVSLAYIAWNVGLQVSAPIGETVSSIPLIAGMREGSGLVGRALAEWRMLHERKQANKIFDKYEYIVGKGAIASMFEAGKNFDARILESAYAALKWGRTRTLKAVLMTFMTDAEFAAGEMSPERIAEFQRIIGRWMDIHGMKSVLGATSLGASFTKFKGWMLPILRTTLQDIGSLLHSAGVKVESFDVPGSGLVSAGLKTPGKILGNNKPLTSRQAAELYGILEATVVASAVWMSFGEVDRRDRSFVGQLKKRILSEIFSLTQSLDVTKLLTPADLMFLIRLGNNIKMFLLLEEYDEDGRRAGELKAPAALAKQMPGSAFVRQFLPVEEPQ